MFLCDLLKPRINQQGMTTEKLIICKSIATCDAWKIKILGCLDLSLGRGGFVTIVSHFSITCSVELRNGKLQFAKIFRVKYSSRKSKSSCLRSSTKILFVWTQCSGTNTLANKYTSSKFFVYSTSRDKPLKVILRPFGNLGVFLVQNFSD